THHPYDLPSRLNDDLFYCVLPDITDIYALSLHDALPIFNDGTGNYIAADVSGSFGVEEHLEHGVLSVDFNGDGRDELLVPDSLRSEEHTSELQSRENLVCRLLLEKKKTMNHGCFPRLQPL